MSKLDVAFDFDDLPRRWITMNFGCCPGGEVNSVNHRFTIAIVTLLGANRVKWNGCCPCCSIIARQLDATSNGEMEKGVRDCLIGGSWSNGVIFQSFSFQLGWSAIEISSSICPFENYIFVVRDDIELDWIGLSWISFFPTAGIFFLAIWRESFSFDLQRVSFQEWNNFYLLTKSYLSL